jgi:hypothetical protein
MHLITSLTVSESKRLIAKGILKDPRVEKALKEGRVAVVPGTTTGYIMEELLGRFPKGIDEKAFGAVFDKHKFVAGRTLPSGYDGPKLENTLPAILFQGDEIKVMSAGEAAREMKAGDVFIKSVNAINYELDQAGVLIGHPEGGNVGEALGPIAARRILYLHPVGLEKNVCTDLEQAARLVAEDGDGKGPTLWMVPGPLFTEIEALEVLAGVDAVPISSGGVGGAEGAVWLAIFGDQKTLDKAREVIDGVKGEPPFC